MEPKSFTIDPEGHPRFLPLDSSIHLKLSGTSFRIPAQQSRFVFYEAKADKLPAWFVIYSTFAQPATNGLNVNVQLPHTVYLLQKDRFSRQDLRVEEAVHDRVNRTIEFTIVNSSDKLGRVNEWELKAPGTQQRGGGFPLLPLSRRIVRTNWDSTRPAESLSIRFENFVLTQPLILAVK